MIIRGARPEEREALKELQRRVSLAGEYRDPIEAHPDAIELPADHIESTLVAEVDGSIAGFAVIQGGELDGLFVEASDQGCGIGTALVEAAVHQARRRGLSLVTVVAGPSARQFYEKCGFSVEGDAETRFGPALKMSR